MLCLAEFVLWELSIVSVMIQHSCSARVQWPRLADFRTLTEICKNDIILIVSRFSAKAQEARELIENRS